MLTKEEQDYLEKAKNLKIDFSDITRRAKIKRAVYRAAREKAQKLSNNTDTLNKAYFKPIRQFKTNILRIGIALIDLSCNSRCYSVIFGFLYHIWHKILFLIFLVQRFSKTNYPINS